MQSNPLKPNRLVSKIVHYGQRVPIRGITRSFVIATFVGLLASCAALSEEECLYMNWKAMGVMDGYKGTPASEIREYQRKCETHGVSVDATSYEAGRVEGVAHYCTTANGFEVAMTGREYQFACTQDNEQDFLRGYNPGRNMYISWREVKNVQEQLYQEEQYITSADRRISKLISEIASNEITEQDKERRRNQLRDVRDEAADAHRTIGYLKAQLPSLVAACSDVKRHTEELGFIVEVRCY